MPGFQISSLTLQGGGLPDASVDLLPGLNVICGPSDTGKTFMFECIDYILGASRPPKEIPEAARYETVRARISVTDDGAEMTLSRGVSGGEVRLVRASGGEEVLGGRHDPARTDTVSHLLLQLSGLAGKVVRVNARGETRQLSFRDVSHLVMVGEEGIIKDGSPIVSGQYTTQTVESSVFRLMMSGVDDAAVVAKEEPKLSKLREEERKRTLDLLRAHTAARLEELGVGRERRELLRELGSIEETVRQAERALATEQESTNEAETRRLAVWRELKVVESRSAVIVELRKRFVLLEQQYGSDLRRLAAIAEAGAQLALMKEERCPVCGAPAEHHSPEHQARPADPSEVADSCRAEAAKIETLRRDLAETLASTAVQAAGMDADLAVVRARLAELDRDLGERLRPRVARALEEVRSRQGRRDQVVRALDAVDQLDALEGLVVGNVPASREPHQRASWSEDLVGVEDLCMRIERLLTDWRLPNTGRVTFDSKSLDLMVGGRLRRGHGKGFRAITHAAFNVALLSRCRELHMPHPGVVVLDSPLVAYREPDADTGELGPEVKAAFYRSLAASVRSAQVIIFENEEPPADVEGVANVVRFSGGSGGRAGFITRT